MTRLTPDNLDPAEMHLSPAEVGALLSRLPADHPMAAAARAGLEVGEAQREAALRGPRWSGSGTGREAMVGEEDERRAAWQRQAEQDGPESAAARRVREIDAATASRDTEPADRRPVEPTRWTYPDGRQVDATQQCLEWARRHEAERAAADAARQRFADSPVEYGADDSGRYVDDEHDQAEQLAMEEPDWDGEIARAGGDVEQLRSLWWQAPPEARERIGERGKALTGDQGQDAGGDVDYPPCDDDADGPAGYDDYDDDRDDERDDDADCDAA